MKIKDLVKELRKPYKMEKDSILKEYLSEKGNYFHIVRNSKDLHMQKTMCEGEVSSLEISRFGKPFVKVNMTLINYDILEGYSINILLKGAHLEYSLGCAYNGIYISEFATYGRVTYIFPKILDGGISCTIDVVIEESCISPTPII